MPNTISFPKLTVEDYQALSKDVDNEEIRQAVFGMQPWKASGPDRFPAGFIKKLGLKWVVKCLNL